MRDATAATDTALPFHSYKDIRKLEKFMQGKPVAEQEIGKLLLLETVSYAEKFDVPSRRCCTISGRNIPERTAAAATTASTPNPDRRPGVASHGARGVARPGGQVQGGITWPACWSVKNTALIKSYGHNKSEWFGAGADHDIRYWGAVIRQASIMGLIDKNIENYGLLSINAKGEEFAAPRSGLYNPRP